MQTNLFDDLKSIKEKITHQEKITKEKVVDEQIKEKEEKLQQQFIAFMKNSGVKKIN